MTFLHFPMSTAKFLQLHACSSTPSPLLHTVDNSLLLPGIHRHNIRQTIRFARGTLGTRIMATLDNHLESER